eukprot:5398401-Heterocapsa_arctica.AAC.1
MEEEKKRRRREEEEASDISENAAKDILKAGSLRGAATSEKEMPRTRTRSAWRKKRRRRKGSSSRCKRCCGKKEETEKNTAALMKVEADKQLTGMHKAK